MDDAHTPVRADVVALLAGRPGTDSDEQAFPFLTGDPAGYPHVALLSRSELEISTSGLHVLAAIASTRTMSHLSSTRRATIIAIEGTTAHYVKLALVATIDEDRLLGCVLAPIEHTADSIGVPISPIMFHTSPALAEMESWQRTQELLSRLDALSSS